MLTSVVHDYTTIDHAGAKITGGSLKGTTTVVWSSGGAFAEGATFLAACVAYATISEAETDIRGACSLTDGSGDSWFVLAKRSIGVVEVGGGGAGRRELVGGIGKYVDIGGSCSYETEYLPDNFLVSSADCTWRR